MPRFLIVAALALVSTAGHQAYAQFSSRYAQCEPVVEEQLDRIQVDRSDIEKIFYTRQLRGSGENARVVGVDGWVRFHSCKGYLVIDMNNQCRVRQVYTRGECKIPGVKSFF
jgi:hypothetical protein